jgi:ABC-type uncharacterized transport system involved in gliding motility auxiliary subunit
MNARIIGFTSLVLLAALFVAFNVLAGTLLRPTRLDLTQGKLYTLTDGSKNIARSPAEPVTLTFYYSEKVAQGRPQVQAIAGRIGELLDEFARASDGKVKVQRVDPEAFSEDEDKAVQAGLAGIPAGSGETIYLGLVGTNTIGGREVIPLFDIANERFIEYDVARLVQSLSMNKKPLVSIISSLSIDSGFSMDPQTGRPVQKKGWAFLKELRQLYEVKVLSGEVLSVPPQTTVLLVIHPKNLTPKTLFAIDQYVLKGGHTIIYVDPLCEADDTQANPRMPAAGADRSSDLQSLFAAWGVGYDQTKVVADGTLAMHLMAGRGGRQDQVEFPPYIRMDERGFSKTDPATGKLTSMNFALAGALSKKEPEAPADAAAPKAGPEFTPIIETTTNAELIDASSLLAMTDPNLVLANFKPEGKKFVLAARLGGTLKTAFPQGDPAGAAPDAGKQGPNVPPSTDSLKVSAKPASVVLIADVDTLADRMWIREQNFGGISLGSMKLGDNIDFLTTCIDIFSGSGDLLGVRARGEYIRPFSKVEDIQKAAEQKFRSEQESLKKKADAAEQKIMEIQRKRPDAPDSAAIILTEEQRKEIEKLQAERLETRKQLRKVQFNMHQDVERLGAWVKVINMGLVPVLVMLIAVLWGAVRLFTRRAAAARSGG